MSIFSIHTRLVQIAGIVILLIAGAGCKKDFLENKPKGKLIAENTEDYYMLLSNAIFNNGGGSAQILLGDEVASIEPYYTALGATSKRLFDYQDDIYLPADQNTEMTILMPAIYLCNMIINEVMDSKNGTTARKRSVMAEAKAVRAWTNFLLINFYGKPYYAATSATDPGFPIITETDVLQKSFTRASVEEMYAFIVKDLTDAIADLPVSLTYRTRMSRPAAEGLLGKVYVFMHRYSEASALFQAAFADLSSAAIAVRLYDYNTAFSTGGSFTPVSAFGPTMPSSYLYEENLYARPMSNVWRFISNEAVLSPDVYDLFNTADQRLKLYVNNPYGGTAYPSVRFQRKMAGAFSEIGVLLPDLYLLSAECKARTGDTTGAKQDLLLLRNKRLPATAVALPATGLTQLQWIQYVLDERTREFAVDGYRWFDMRRLSVDPLFSSKTYSHKVYDASGVLIKTIPLRPERLTLRIPTYIMDQNPGMENNP